MDVFGRQYGYNKSHKNGSGGMSNPVAINMSGWLIKESADYRTGIQYLALSSCKQFLIKSRIIADNNQKDVPSPAMSHNSIGVNVEQGEHVNFTRG